MSPLALTPGTVAVRSDKVVVVVEVRRGPQLRVRDIASGEISIAKASELTARTLPAIERQANLQLAALTKADQHRWAEASVRERLVIAALSSRSAIATAARTIAAREKIGLRTLLRWISRYRAWPHTSALLS